jgi:glycosyltransferase involved in cell wall biosynthesis
MSAAPAPQDAIQQAWTLLQQNPPTQEILALVEPISAGQPHFAQAQHVRGVCAAREGDAERAKALLIDAIRHGEQSSAVWLNLAGAAAAIGLPDDALSMLLKLLKRISTPQLFPFALQLLRVLGFANKERHPRKDVAFTKLLLPMLSTLLDRRDMDGAIAFEAQLYEYYVKPTETEAHFAWCMGKIAPLFTASAHYWRDELPPMSQSALAPPYRIGFFIHNASMLAHIEVLLNTLKGYRMLDDQPFEPTVYCFSGKNLQMEQALSRLGVRLVMLNELFPETQRSSWQRLLRFRELLSEEGVQELVWVSLVTMLPLAFGMRLAPVQTWFAMKYRNFSQEDIDGYVTGSALTRFGTLCGRRWRMAMLGVDDWYDPSVEAEAATLRAPLKDRLVVMTLARTEKMEDPAYLLALTSILKAHPGAFFLWAGREESPAVINAFERAGVLDRTRFIGWVNTRLYAQVADVFLDTFPFPCGFTLFQAMAAAKPVVIYDSPEAAQTGLWNFLKPLVDDDEGTAEERAELRSLIGDDADPLISVARTPEQYVRHASRLIGDAEARAAAGEASRRFMARYFSDPRVMGSSLARHFVELIEERRALQSA